MHYERGMSIWYQRSDAVVYFRGVRHLVPGPFPTFMAAAKAGEAFCRHLGWNGGERSETEMSRSFAGR
jgi:hypothetical protein